MIAKGLDFNDVTLVGVVNGDATLNIPDFRSGERTYSLLNQVAGRSGRTKKDGKVINGHGEIIVDSFTTEELAKKDLHRIISDFKRFFPKSIVNEEDDNSGEDFYQVVETDRIKYMYWIKKLFVRNSLY